MIQFPEQLSGRIRRIKLSEEEDENGFDLGAITGNWGKNISYDGKEPRIAEYFGGARKAINNPSSFFYQKTALDIFLLAMAVGKHYGIRKKIENARQNLPKNSLTDKQTWAMIATALAEEKSDIMTLKDGSQIYKICEEYANGGIDEVIDWDEGGSTTNTIKQFLDKFDEFLD